ncbi:MAG: nitroreductase family protein [Spirochaetaceae bacterium]|jgi:nitroreductase|nr:nitroreductase family protein [Spirochaetaceae bacterium]
MKTTLEDLKKRRSIRAFKSEQITDAELDQILEVGTFAPSGANMQSAVIVVAQEPLLIRQLEELNARVLKNPQAHPFFGAPTVLSILVDITKATPVEDGALVIGNLLHAAAALGIGSCWIHRAKEVFASPEGQALLRTWGLGEQYIGVGHCILGYPADPDYPPQAAPRKAGYIIKV